METRNVDAYHTCYNLAGLSSAQHNYILNTATNKPSSIATTDWVNQNENEIPSEDIGVSTMHPVYVISLRAVVETRRHFANATNISE